MKHFTLIFAASICIAIVAVPQPKTKTVPVDEVEMMLEKISKNLQAASVATAQAQAMGEAMVESKVAEKAELKQAVVAAKAKAEVYAARMLFSGVDTTMPAKGEPIVDTVSINNMMKLNGL
jgi:uncharacterized protein YejL (UPF0352 family)